jgi:hypothetical protein
MAAELSGLHSRVQEQLVILTSMEQGIQRAWADLREFRKRFGADRLSASGSPDPGGLY